jgi:hypothetical protein
LCWPGTEDVQAAYRQANSYKHLLEEGIECRPDQLNFDQIRQRAYEVVQRQVQEARNRTAAMYHQLAGTGGTANDMGEVVAAAYRGQVQYLFADRRREQWGTFDPTTQKTHVHPREEPGDEDLLNAAVVHTLAHKGTVYAVEPRDLPDKTPLAAIFWLPIGERGSQRAIPDVMAKA